MKKSVGDEAAARGRRISDESLATSPIFFASAPAQESARYFFPIFPRSCWWRSIPRSSWWWRNCAIWWI